MTHGAVVTCRKQARQRPRTQDAVELCGTREPGPAFSRPLPGYPSDRLGRRLDRETRSSALQGGQRWPRRRRLTSPVGRWHRWRGRNRLIPSLWVAKRAGQRAGRRRRRVIGHQTPTSRIMSRMMVSEKNVTHAMLQRVVTLSLAALLA